MSRDERKQHERYVTDSKCCCLFRHHFFLIRGGDVFVNASIEYDWIHLDSVKKNRLGLAGKQVPLRPCFEQFARGPNEDERLLHVAP